MYNYLISLKKLSQNPIVILMSVNILVELVQNLNKFIQHKEVVMSSIDESKIDQSRLSANIKVINKNNIAIKFKSINIYMAYYIICFNIIYPYKY